MSASDATARFSLRLPADLLARLYEVRGVRSVNAEIVERLERSFGAALGCSASTVLRALGHEVAPAAAKDARLKAVKAAINGTATGDTDG